MGKILDYFNSFMSQFPSKSQLGKSESSNETQNVVSDLEPSNSEGKEKCKSCQYVSVATLASGTGLAIYVTKRNINKFQGVPRYMYCVQGFLFTLGLTVMQIRHYGPLKDGVSLYELILKDVQLLKSFKLPLKKE